MEDECKRDLKEYAYPSAYYNGLTKVELYTIMLMQAHISHYGQSTDSDNFRVIIDNTIELAQYIDYKLREKK